MMAKLVHADTNEILGERVAWNQMPYHIRMLFHPFKKNKKLVFFRDFMKPSVYGCILKEKEVSIE